MSAQRRSTASNEQNDDAARYHRFGQLVDQRRAVWRQLGALSDQMEATGVWGWGLEWLGGAAVAVFSCRVEFPLDAIRFLEAVETQESSFMFRVRLFQHEQAFAGVLEFKTTLAAVALRALLDAIPDTHVMVETLRPVPLADNCLARVFPFPLTLDPDEPARWDEDAEPEPGMEDAR